MKSRWLIFIFILLLSTTLSAQSLFEKAASGKDKEKPYELNGYLRGTLFAGEVPNTNEGEIKSGYGEVSLKLRVRKMNFGDGFAEIRYRTGHEFGESMSELDLREAYVNAYVGPFDFRIGHQIVAWGRADGMNPTDNITPKNMIARSPNEDDRRKANFLIRSYFNIHPVRLEAIWVPFFKSSVIPTNFLDLPPNVTLLEMDYPEARLENSAFAVKLNLELPSFDGSLSYFKGYNPFPLIDLSISVENGLNVFPIAYEMQVLGADFSTTIGSFGLRGEMAYKKPYQDYTLSDYIPNRELHYVVGIDKEFSNDFNVILQYIGKYVFDFTDLEVPPIPGGQLLYMLDLKNRMVASQQYETSYSLSLRAEWRLLYETLRFEVLSMVNITSEESLVRPKLTYDIADALNFTLGAELYSGPDDTLFGTIDSHLGAVFTELKISF